MRLNNLVLKCWLISLILLAGLICKASEEVPCLIFSGKASTTHNLDLAKLNRITFGDNSMIITSSNSDSDLSVNLLYSHYHHLEVDHATPTDLSLGLETVNWDSGARLLFNSETKQLFLKSPDISFNVYLFDMNGKMVLSTILNDGEEITLNTLPVGVYIAVATSKTYKFSLKLILN